MMRKVLVTVGTTRFESLISSVMLSSIPCEFIVQTGPQSTRGLRKDNADFFNYSNDIVSMYHEADVVVSHAGAGTVYKVLEIGKPLVVFPNLQRHDKHQSEMAVYLQEKNLSYVSFSTNDFDFLLEKALSEEVTSRYEKEDFFKVPEIVANIVGKG